jgi:hypothetical protein
MVLVFGRAVVRLKGAPIRQTIDDFCWEIGTIQRWFGLKEEESIRRKLAASRSSEVAQ